MYFLDYSFPTHAQNLAWDEAIIEVADRHALELEELLESKTSTNQHDRDHSAHSDVPNSDGSPTSTALDQAEVLRLWEMPSHCVILGRSSRLELEVDQSACDASKIPILRRVSGGATVVAGPGCLMYSTLLSYKSRPNLRSLDVAHHAVMTRIQNATQRTLKAFGIPDEVHLQGTCDLTINDRKFSGNALRCKRFWMLYHGTILCDFPTHLVSKLLQQPPRQPDYRNQRSHDDFVRPLLASDWPVNPDLPDLGRSEQEAFTESSSRSEHNRSEHNRQFVEHLKNELVREWAATLPFEQCPWKNSIDSEMANLMRTRYDNDRWHRGLNT